MSYHSQSKAVEDDLMSMMNADISILAMFIEDTFKPSLHIYNIKIGLLLMMNELKQFEIKSGETDKSKERKEMLLTLIRSSECLDKIATQSNMFQLAMKHQDLENKSLRSEINTLKQQIENLNREL